MHLLGSHYNVWSKISKSDLKNNMASILKENPKYCKVKCPHLWYKGSLPEVHSLYTVLAFFKSTIR